jgi:hypothetical protein
MDGMQAISLFLLHTQETYDILAAMASKTLKRRTRRARLRRIWSGLMEIRGEPQVCAGRVMALVAVEKRKKKPVAIFSPLERACSNLCASFL